VAETRYSIKKLLEFSRKKKYDSNIIKNNKSKTRG
jgi:hypothetical protein